VEFNAARAKQRFEGTIGQREPTTNENHSPLSENRRPQVDRKLASAEDSVVETNPNDEEPAIPTWHPFTLKFPDIEGEAWESFTASIRKTHGVVDNPVLYRVIDGQNQGLDGRNRLRACQELKLKCAMKRVEVPDEEVIEFILRQNLHRRHLTPELRQALVAELRTDGKSIRRIAGALGVSPSTVQEDLSSQVYQSGTPATVVGRDGKTYPSKIAKVILCSECQRVGARKNCPWCRDARAEARSLARRQAEAIPVGTGRAGHQGETFHPDVRTQTQPQAAEAKDAFGNVLPKRCRDAYGDPWLQDTYDFLTGISEKFRMQRTMEGMAKRAKRYPFFRDKDVIGACTRIIHDLDKLIDHFKTQRPAGVCPSCDGKGCGFCKMSGLLPRSLYQKLKGAAQ
jgi:hypothetical protein